MSDVISRQAVKEILDKNQLPYHKYPYVWDAINALPPTQPALCEDAVSRKAVAGIYTALWETIGTIMDRDEWDDVCKATANELPPAQLGTNLAEVGTDCISRADVEPLQPWEVLAAQAVLSQPKMGKWIYHIDDLFPAESTMECNQCHAEQPLTCDDEFCPHCGAKMEATK